MIINEQSPKPNVLKPSKYQLLVGFDAYTLHEMYGEEKSTQLFATQFGDMILARECAEKAICIALTLHAMGVQV